MLPSPLLSSIIHFHIISPLMSSPDLHFSPHFLISCLPFSFPGVCFFHFSAFEPLKCLFYIFFFLFLLTSLPPVTMLAHLSCFSAANILFPVLPLAILFLKSVSQCHLLVFSFLFKLHQRDLHIVFQCGSAASGGI